MVNFTSVSEPTKFNLKYRFDAQNRRISRIKNNAITHSWLYLDQLCIAAELNADGSLKQQFAYGEKMNVPSVILRPEQNGTVLYRVISDHLGSVRLVVNSETGAIAQRMRYEEYGQVLEDTNPRFQPFGYAGGLYDSGTGLVRFGARDYDPEIGRWLAKDPIRFGGRQPNFYLYVNADPVNKLDPTGLCEGPTCYERCVEEETISGLGGGAIGEDGQIVGLGLGIQVEIAGAAFLEGSAGASVGIGGGAAAAATTGLVILGVGVPFFELTARLRCSLVCESDASYY